MCRACQLHGTTCRAQGTSLPEYRESHHHEVETRVKTLESMLAGIFKAADVPLDIDADEAELDVSMRKLVDRIQSGPETVYGRHDARAAESGGHRHESKHETPENFETHRAPLLQLLRETALRADQGLQDSITHTKPRSDSVLDYHREQLRRILPRSSDVTIILESTQKYWALWPIHPVQLSQSKTLTVSVVSIASSFLEESVRAAAPAVTARAVIWLALCIQQVPRALSSEISSILPSATEIVLRYIEMADKYLSLDAHNGFSMTGLVCLVLEAKCYVNMGRPRKAWMSIRRALDQGLLLGLNDPMNRAEPEQERTWATICGYDCQLSMILGVPQALSEASFPKAHLDQPIEAKIMRRSSLLCSQINNRNLDYRESSYAATLKIDESLEDLRAMFPGEWWDLANADQLPLEVFHTRQTLKLYYFQLRQLTHLPYMLKAQADKKYHYSRTSVLEAAEGMIRTYGERRLHPDGLNIMCFLLDFLAFSAGMVLAADIISQESMRTSEAASQKWALISTLISELKHASNALEHPVAEQSAGLLEYLHSACNGMYDGPETYEAVVPYFGRVLIKRPQPQSAYASGTSSLSELSSPSMDALAGRLALESNIFEFGSFPTITTAELDMDWTAIFDDPNVYDWTGSFDF